MVRAAHRETEPDHVMRHQHANVKRRRPCVVAPPDADPCHTGSFRLLDRFLGGKVHYQLPHAVVAVNERHARRFALDTNIRFGVDRATLDAADVLRQAGHTLAVNGAT